MIRQSAMNATIDLNTRKGDLNGRTVKMVTITWDPFIIRHERENGTWYTGLCIDLLDYIARDLNFSYSISEQADRSWGQQLANGTWIGLTGSLHRKEADFALSGISVTADRATVSDHTISFYYNEVVLLVSRPVAEVGLTFLLRPFHWLVYVVIGLCLLSVTLLFVCLEINGQRWKHEDRDMAKSSGGKLWSCVTKTLEMSYGALLGRAVEYKGVSWAGQVLLCAWLMLSLVMVAVYTGKLTAISVVTAGTVPFSTLRDLVRQDTYKWGMIRGTMYESIMSNSENKDYQQYYKGVLRFAENDPSVFSKNLSVHINKVLSEKYVTTMSSASYEQYKKIHCELTVVPERLFSDTFAIHLQKDSPYTELFSQSIRKAEEFGLLHYWRRKWFDGENRCEHSGDRRQVVSVSLHLLQSAFALAAGGIVLAGLTLAMECLLRCPSASKRFKKILEEG